MLDLHLSDRSGGRAFFERSEAGHVDMVRAQASGDAGGFFAVFVTNDQSVELQETSAGYEDPLADTIDHDHAKSFTVDVLAQLYSLEQQSDGAFRVGQTIDDIRAALADDGSFAFIYSPYGAPFSVEMEAIDALRVRQIWYSPRYGNSYHSHTSDNTGFQTFTPPSSGRGHDWVLILEDDARDFPLPGGE